MNIKLHEKYHNDHYIFEVVELTVPEMKDWVRTVIVGYIGNHNERNSMFKVGVTIPFSILSLASLTKIETLVPRKVLLKDLV